MHGAFHFSRAYSEDNMYLNMPLNLSQGITIKVNAMSLLFSGTEGIVIS